MPCGLGGGVLSTSICKLSLPDLEEITHPTNLGVKIKIQYVLLGNKATMQCSADLRQKSFNTIQEMCCTIYHFGWFLGLTTCVMTQPFLCHIQKTSLMVTQCAPQEYDKVVHFSQIIIDHASISQALFCCAYMANMVINLQHPNYGTTDEMGSVFICCSKIVSKNSVIKCAFLQVFYLA